MTEETERGILITFRDAVDQYRRQLPPGPDWVGMLEQFVFYRTAPASNLLRGILVNSLDLTIDNAQGYTIGHIETLMRFVEAAAPMAAVGHDYDAWLDRCSTLDIQPAETEGSN